MFKLSTESWPSKLTPPWVHAAHALESVQRPPLAAADGGADRLEIVRDIRSGGLTPPLSLVSAIAASVTLPLRVMVRENAGYEMDPNEVPALQRAVAQFAGIGVDGLVAGFSKRGALSIADLAVVL